MGNDWFYRLESKAQNWGWRIFTNFLPLYFTEKHFENLYRHKRDPWNYEHSHFEREKYLKTLQAIPEEVETIWEIGCGEGVFTQLLLEKGKRVRGVDISPTALSRARERLKDFDDRVCLQKLNIAREDIEGTFDLILASEILYYLGGKDVLQPLEEKFFRHLRPFGYLLLCHFYPSGKIIHNLYQENHRFYKVFEEVTYHPHRDYIITLLKRNG
ncbi:MAG TPA: class I SAM-dependent methyltransferase [Candidatus Atribacteria bacterium]|nr:class I SAM-dependent methyltransferase [Candidatus Atribacteria bacterium]HQE25751.1 class I SAM-dependent methyltransferase [Candidatus Atribacteria bacterium]